MLAHMPVFMAGEFSVSPYPTGSVLFNTFCVEWSEHLNFGSEFKVGGISNSASFGEVWDLAAIHSRVQRQLSFMRNICWRIRNYDQHKGRGYTASHLVSEGEITSPNILAAVYTTCGSAGAMSAFTGFRFINLYKSCGIHLAQDVLIRNPRAHDDASSRSRPCWPGGSAEKRITNKKITFCGVGGRLTSLPLFFV